MIEGRFELLERVGAGGTGVVYRARDLSSGGLVAFKELHGLSHDDGVRFARECALLAAVADPAVVRYVAHGAGARSWLAMEWVDGPTLSTVLRQRGLLWDESVGMARRVARALGALHRLGILHRDVKPGNIILEGGDPLRPRLIDLGVARPQDDDALTVAGVVVGTAGYMAPEQASGSTDIDARVDVFALGCLLFRCIAGRAPFTGEDALTVMLKVTLEDAPRLSEVEPRVSVDLDDAVAAMLARDRDRRPRDGDAAATLLEAIHDIETVPSRRSHEDLGAVTTTERRLVFLVLARLPQGAAVSRQGEPRSVGRALEPLGLTAELLADGTWVSAIAAEAAAGDLAVRAARAALAVRAVLPEALVTITVGRTGGRGVLVGEAAERASRLFSAIAAAPGKGHIAADSGTARLLVDRFVIKPREFGAIVAAELPGGGLGAVDLAGPFVGRDHEVAYLEGLIRRTVSERQARAVVLVAPTGFGKSRLTRELLGRVELGVDVWVAQGDPLTARTPFGVLAPMLFKQAGVVRGEPHEASLRKLCDLASDLVPEEDAARVGSFLGELCGLRVADVPGSALAAARRDPMLMGDQMRRALGALVEGACTDRGLLLVVEDLQWADQGSLSFLDALLRSLESRPLAILCLGRPEIKVSFGPLFSERTVHEIKLDPLSAAASEALTRALMGPEASAKDVGRIAARSGGNPFFIEELVRSAPRDRMSSLPESVLSVLEARLEAVPTDVRRTLRAASVFGRTFWEGALTSLLPGAPVARHLRDLERAEIIRRSPTSRYEGQEEWSFRHALLAEASYARLPSKDSRRAHRAAARWLERVGEGDPTLLAAHLERGGEANSAVGLLAGAAHLAVEATDMELAVSLAQRAVRAGAQGEDLGRVLGDEAEARLWLGQNPEALAVARRALPLLPSGSVPWCRAATVVVTAGCRTHDRAAVQLVVDALAQVAPADTGQAEHTNLLAQTAIQLIFLGNLDAADRVLGRAPTGLAQREPGQAAWLLRARAWRALAAGDPAAYGMLMRHSAISFDEIGDLRNACVQRANVAYSAMILGQYDDADARFREAITEASTLAVPMVLAVARHNRGLVLARLGRFDEAEAEERAAVEAFRGQGDRRMLAASLGYQADIARARGDLEAAEAAARAAVREAPEGSPVVGIVLATLALVLLDRARTAEAVGARLIEEALETAEQASRVLDLLGGVDEGESCIRLAHARALSAAGLTDDARAAARAARTRLLSRAERIGEHLRPTFLGAVPENAETLALAESLGA